MSDAKLKIKISGMHCSSCAMDIDGTLEDSEGIRESRTSYAKAECEVTFDSSKISEDGVVKIINSTGYKVLSGI